MANPRFYWYPTEMYSVPWTTSTGDVHIVDIDEPISDLQVSMHRSASDAITYTMRKHRRHYKPYLEVRVILERFTDESLARELYSMESHLQKGNHVGFTADRAKTWASWAGRVSATMGSEVISQGTRIFSVNGSAMAGSVGYANIFRHWESAATVAIGDIINIDGRVPDFNHEELQVASGVSLGSTARDGTVYVEQTHNGGYTRYPYLAGSIVRYRDFWPYLCLPQSGIGKPLLTHDHRISYTFDAVFHYYPGWMSTLQTVRDPGPDITTQGPVDRNLGTAASGRSLESDRITKLDPKGSGPGLWDGSWG